MTSNLDEDLDFETEIFITESGHKKHRQVKSTSNRHNSEYTHSSKSGSTGPLPKDESSLQISDYCLDDESIENLARLPRNVLESQVKALKKQIAEMKYNSQTSDQVSQTESVALGYSTTATYYNFKNPDLRLTYDSKLNQKQNAAEQQQILQQQYSSQYFDDPLSMKPRNSVDRGTMTSEKPIKMVAREI